MRLPIVFLHGFLGTSKDFTPLLTHLPQIEPYLLDLPGHGKNLFTPLFDLKVSTPKFHLVGYSMGGRLALQYACKHRERIGKLFLLSAHSGLARKEERKERLLQDALWKERLLSWEIDDFLTAWYDQPLFGGFRPDFSLRRELNREEAAKTLMHYSLGRQKPLHFAGAIFLVGERDRKYRALYPHAHLIPDAAHAIHLENPKAVAKLIEKEIS